MSAVARARSIARVALAALLALTASAPAAAQDVPTVFIHGLASSAEAWRDTATRLEQQVRITAFGMNLDWRDWYENQAQAVHAGFSGLPPGVIAVGHSNGGIVARQWSRHRSLRSIVTLGTPHQGALLAARALDAVSFNQQLFNSANFLISILAGNPNEFTWMWPFLAAHLGWTASLTSTSIVELATTLGVTIAAPVLGQMVPGSAFLNQLNSPGNLAREAAAVGPRVGLVFVAREYWRGGIAVAARPEWQDAVADNTQVAAVMFDAAAAYLRAYYPPYNTTAQTLLRVFQDAAYALRMLDPFWCWAVTNDWSCAISHDGVVSTPSQHYPGGINMGFYGPAHIREIAWAPETLRGVFMDVLHVPSRNSPPPPPPPPPGGGSGPSTLTAGQRLTPDMSIQSANGAYRLLYQTDGNLVIYQNGGGPVWASHTAGHSAGSLEMQGDGNLVVYDATGQPVWASDTATYSGAYATLLDDGHLVIYAPGGVAVWWSGGSE